MPRLWRALHESLPAEVGAIVELDADESHHVLRVLRLRAGEPLALFDGQGAEWRATLLTGAGARASVRLDAPIVEPEVEPVLCVTLYQALLKPDRMDWVIQKATELGVLGLSGFVTERSEPARTSRPERWRRIAVEAAKQSLRRRLPVLEAAAELPAAPPGTAAFILDPRSALPLGAGFPGGFPRAVWIASGPQGGFTPEEIERARAAGYEPVALGPRVLRADTAGVVAVAIAMHRWGDLGAVAPGAD